ncbi:hypothetical protein KKHLCK_01715 [Candidatus Electrothrix laxa]
MPMRMTPEVQQRIVSIALPLIGDKPDQHAYFSGYILGNGIIITCFHGFSEPEGKYDSQRPIVIQFQAEILEEISFQGETAADLMDMSAEKLLIFFSDKHDVALLKCDKAKGQFDGLLMQQLDKRGDWDAGGYPRYNIKNEAAGGYENFSGVFNAPAITEHRLKLNITNPQLDAMESWQEVSGSPVFINDKLAGIVIAYSTFCNLNDQEEERKNGLTVALLQRLWDADKQFQTLLEKIDSSFDKSEKILQQAESLLKPLLKNNEQLKNALDSEANVGQIVRNLTKQNLSDFLDHLDALKTATQEDRRALALTLLPWYFIDQSVIIDRSTENTIDIQCVYDVAAECSMAALDCRKANIDVYLGGQGITSQDYQPVVTKGRYALSPECGIDEGVKKSLDALNDNILSSSALDKVLLERFTREGDSFPKIMVKNRLKEGRKKGETYYLVVKLNKSSPELEKITEYKKNYPDLIILNLEGNDEELAERQMPLFTQLPAIIAERNPDAQ